MISSFWYYVWFNWGEKQGLINYRGHIHGKAKDIDTTLQTSLGKIATELGHLVIKADNLDTTLGNLGAPLTDISTTLQNQIAVPKTPDGTSLVLEDLPEKRSSSIRTVFL